MKSGSTKSCGCLKATRLGLSRRTHGQSQTRLYKIWKDVRKRCSNKSNQAYDRYGGRGIKVCDEWDNNFQAFCEWSMNNGYGDSLSIDRIDNDGDYTPDNCRWANRQEQVENTRNNIFISINGEIRTAAEWSKITNISRYTLYSRISAEKDISDLLPNAVILKG